MRALDISGVPADVRHKMGLAKLPLDQALTRTTALTELSGRCALVTGAGGSGLGNAIAHRMADAGAVVAVLDIDQGRAQQTVVEIQERFGADRAFAVVADSTDWNALDEALSVVAERTGGIDILVANVGGSGAQAGSGQRAPIAISFAGADQASIDRVVRTNLLGSLYVATLASRRMVARGQGRIILISSQNANAAVPGVAVYSSCEAALHTLAKCMASELGPLGVSTVCVAPGLMIGQEQLDVLSTPSPLAEVLAGGADLNSLGRPGTFDDVASVVTFLATDAASYIHGTTITVAGGIGG